MASSYVNDLRLNEMATGDASGTWGETTNTNLELIAEAFSYGTEAITTNADTHTTTIADGATDPGRSMFLKYTGTLDSTCTITIGPNTVSKLWIIENGTSGSQSIIIKQGSGATVTIPSGKTKVIYSDGAGSGGAMVDAFASLNLQTSGIIESSSSIQTPLIEFTDGDDAMTIADGGQVTFAQNIIGTLGTAAQANITSLGTLTGLTVNGDVTLTGSSNNIVFDQSDDSFEFADNAKAKFGASDDLQIYHDGSNSRIQEGGTGSLLVRGSNLQLQDSDGFDYLTCTDGGDGGTVALKHLGSTVLSTASDGIDVTGTINDLTIAAGNIQTNTSNNLSINTPNSLRINIDSNNDGTAENFVIGHNQTAVDASNNVLLLVTESGKVSIGGTNPNATLQVGEGTTSGDTTNPAIQIGRTSTYRFGMYASTEGAVIENKNGDDGIQFRVKTAGEAMRIDGGTGQVGIGTSSPSSLLHVAGTSGTLARIVGTSASSDVRLLFDAGGTTGQIQYAGASHASLADTLSLVTQADIRTVHAGSQRVTIKSNGKVGIGETSPDELLTVGGDIKIKSTNRLHFTNTSDQTSIHAPASNTMAFTTNSSEKMRITSSGAVGFGTTPPSDTHTGWNQLFIGQKGSLFSENATGTHGIDGMIITDNLYIDSDTGSFANIETNESSAYKQEGGVHTFHSQASGSAGAAVTLSEKMRIDASGRVGIGTTAPTGQRLCLAGHSTNDTIAEANAWFVAEASGGDGIAMGSIASSPFTTWMQSGFLNTLGSANHYPISLNPKGGAVLVGTITSNPVNIANHRLVVDLDSSTSGIAVGADGLTDTRVCMSFYNDNGTVGSITTNASSTAFNTSSDYRLKENVDYTWDATTRLKQLKPARFNFIADKDTTLDGFLAHEVSSIVPEAITGEKDGEQMQGIDQSKLVPLLVKTIQELEARVTALES